MQSHFVILYNILTRMKFINIFILVGEHTICIVAMNMKKIKMKKARKISPIKDLNSKSPFNNYKK